MRVKTFVPILFFILGLIGLCNLIWVLLNWQYVKYVVFEQPTNMSVHKVAEYNCGHQPGGSTIKKSEWLRQDKLSCELSYWDTCELYHWAGDYKIEGDNLRIFYDVLNNSSSACLCEYDIRFTINHIEHRDYKLFFEYKKLFDRD